MKTITKHIPNIMTITRVLFAPIMCAILITDAFSPYVAATIFGIISITDFLDGYIARKLNIVSKFGKCFDNISDKIFQISVLLTLTHLGYVNFVVAIILILREIIVSGLREFVMSDCGKSMPSTFLAKIKTTLQALGMFIIIVANKAPMCQLAGNIILYSAVAASLFTLGGYLVTTYQYINEKQ